MGAKGFNLRIDDPRSEFDCSPLACTRPRAPAASLSALILQPRQVPCGALVTEILPGGLAERSRLLRPNDTILRVDDIAIDQLKIPGQPHQTHKKVTAVLGRAFGVVTLHLERRACDAADAPPAQPSTKLETDTGLSMNAEDSPRTATPDRDLFPGQSGGEDSEELKDPPRIRRDTLPHRTREPADGVAIKLSSKRRSRRGSTFASVGIPAVNDGISGDDASAADLALPRVRSASEGTSHESSLGGYSQPSASSSINGDDSTTWDAHVEGAITIGGSYVPPVATESDDSVSGGGSEAEDVDRRMQLAEKLRMLNAQVSSTTSEKHHRHLLEIQRSEHIGMHVHLVTPNEVNQRSLVKE